MTYPPTDPFRHLLSGRDYVVLRPFTDFDGVLHPVGERWRFIGHSFLPYDDGLSLFVEIESQSRQIRMRWIDGDQGEIVDHIADHLTAAG